MKELFEKLKILFEKHKWFFIFLLTVPFVNDGYVGFSIVPDWIMDRLKIVVLAIMVFLFIRNKRKPSLLLKILFVMESWWMITTWINYGFAYSIPTYKTFIDIVNALTVSSIVEYFKDDGKELLKGLILNFELALYPNFLSIFPNLEERGYYLLGYYAVLILWILPAICIALLYMYVNRKYIRGTILIIISLLTAIITWCATIIVSLMGMAAVIVLGVILIKNKKTENIKLPLSAFVILALLANLFVLFIYNGGGIPFLDFFIEKFLGRTTTFTGRTPIWQEAIEVFLQKPLIGHGFRPELDTYEGFHALHAHNQLLQRLTATGIIGLALFVIFHIVLIIKVDKQENTLARLFMVSGVFAVNLTYIMDAYKKFFRFYFIFFLAYHVEDIIRNRYDDKKLSA